MTVIRPNSVSGINSITAQADEIKVFKSDGTQGGLIIGGANLNATSGISTLLALNVTGNVSIAGTLTYQDVTNVDSVGIITARSTIDAQGDVSIADKIIHTGDTNTALRFPAADTFSVETAGSERLRITSGGDMGLGTNSPASSHDRVLTIAGTNSAELKLTGSNYGVTDTDGADVLFSYGGLYLINNESTGNIHFHTGSGVPERLRIDSSGRFLLNLSSSITGGKFQVNNQYNTFFAATNDANPCVLQLQKTRSTSPGSYTIVQDGDKLGELQFKGSNGSAAVIGANIQAIVNGTPGSGNDLPTDLVFRLMPDGVGSTLERLRITSTGRLLVGGTGNTESDVRLYLHNPSAAGSQIQITGSGSGTGNSDGLRIGYNGSGGQIWLFENQYLRFATSNNERLRIASNGDFGFNDTSPTAHSSGNNTVLSIKGKGSSYSGKIDFKDSDGNLDSYINSDNSILQFYADPNSQNGNTLMRFYVHGAERFRFGAAGQFGIGTNYGTAGQVLKSGGASAAPTWGSASGGHTETYARVVFGAVYDTNSGYIVHNITTGSSNGITIDTTNERVTPTVNGTYLVIYNCHWMGLHSSGTTYYNRITKNGSEYISSNFSAYDPGSHMHTVMTTIPMNGSSDYLQFEFYENKSGAAAYVNHKSRAVVILLDT